MVDQFFSDAFRDMSAKVCIRDGGRKCFSSPNFDPSRVHLRPFVQAKIAFAIDKVVISAEKCTTRQMNKKHPKRLNECIYVLHT